MPAPQSIVLSQLSLSFDEGPPVLNDITATIPTGRVGVVGRNGAGKTTLLRLITGELSPTSGTIAVPGDVATVPQNLLQRPDATVSEILGIADICHALNAIEAGSVDMIAYDVVGNDWDIEARATALLAKRVPSLDVLDALERRARSLSGGELMLAALARMELSRSAVSVLDEPTNNLDATARRRLYEAMEDWPGTLLVVSYDVTLLRRMDAIVEIHAGGLRLFGGNHDVYQEQLRGEQAAAEQLVRTADQKLRSEKRDRDHVQTAMDRRARQNASSFKRVAGGPRLSDPTAKRSAEARRAGEVKEASAKVREARDQAQQAELTLRDDDHIRVDIVDPHTATGRRIADLVGTN